MEPLQVAIQGTVPVSGPIAISGTVPVSGTVAISGTVPVNGTVAVTHLDQQPNIQEKVSNTNVTTDLPAVGGTPLEIDVSSGVVKSVEIFVSNGSMAAPFYFTVAADAASGATRLASNATRSKIVQGYLRFETYGMADKIYIKAVGDAVVEGVSYWFNEVS